MRVINFETVKRWMLAGNLIGKKRPPKPFPGKCPTRIFIVLVKGGPGWGYWGKPSPSIQKQWASVLMKFKWDEPIEYFVGEYDRGGLLYYYWINTTEGAHNVKRNDLYDFYHPGIGHDVQFSWLRWKYLRDGDIYRIGGPLGV